MTQLRFIPATFAASAVFLFSSLSSAIIAPPAGCGTGPACGVGFECNVVGASSCASAAPCVAGSDCPAPANCEPTVEYGCTPAHCSDDAQCAPGMVCHTWTESCPVTDCACAPGSPSCDCVAACDPKAVSMCTPTYLLPCKVASDCGDGFTCEEQVSGCANAGSSGSAGPTPGDADAAPTPAGGSASLPNPIPECSPQPTGVFQCVAKQLMCATDAQCPAGWSCQSDVVASAPTCAPGSNCASDPVAPAPSTWCRPPYYGVESSGGLEKPTTPTSGSGNTGTVTTGTAGSTSTGGTAKPETTNADDATSHESSACQMGHAPASTGALSLLALVGALFGLSRRRRAQKS